MTELSKELITSHNKPSPNFRELSSCEKVDEEQFKEMMRSFKEEQDLDNCEEDEQNHAFFAFAPPTQMPWNSSLSSLSSALSPAILPSEVQALFEQMASTMLLTSCSGEEQTTLLLDSPKFSDSIFYNTRITIKEFSTCPKSFNVEIASNPSALNLLVTYNQALLAAFETHKFTFSVHRLEMHLHSLEELSGDKEEGDKQQEDPQGDT